MLRRYSNELGMQIKGQFLSINFLGIYFAIYAILVLSELLGLEFTLDFDTFRISEHLF